MPTLKNPRHEAFAQALAAGFTADRAYQAAGYKPHRGNASTLRAKQSIRKRTAELMEQAAERTLVTIDSVTAELEEARAKALIYGQVGPAVSASLGKAKLHGLITDKSETKVTLEGLAKRLLGAAIRPNDT
jgi:hypothetical protein